MAALEEQCDVILSADWSVDGELGLEVPVRCMVVLMSVFSEYHLCFAILLLMKTICSYRYTNHFLILL